MGSIGRAGLASCENNYATTDVVDYGEELYLTPLIKSGNSEIARAKACVTNLGNVQSYSGYLTVSEKFQSNIFFWFFPASVSPETAPLILWLQGGPGSSSLIGLFNGCGPFRVNCEGFLESNKATWASNHSILFFDSPVGAGLSFTENAAGYVSNQEEACRDLHIALVQFFELFPEFRPRDFYVAGQSYAGKYVPHLGIKIHNENVLASASMRINLVGFAIGSSFTDPLVQLNWGDFLYNTGLIDAFEKQYFDSETERMQNLIRAEQWFPAFQVIRRSQQFELSIMRSIMQNLMFAFPPPMTSQYERATGLSNTFNLLESGIPQTFFNYRKFIEQPSVRKSIHVGKRQLDFGKTKELVFMTLAEDIPKSARPEMELLLNYGYRMLLYASAFDVVVPHIAVNNLLNSLNWTGSDKFRQCKRRIWKVQNEPAGFVKKSGNLTHVFIRNAGHMATFDQPEWCFDMITRFTGNRNFSSDIFEE